MVAGRRLAVLALSGVVAYGLGATASARATGGPCGDAVIPAGYALTSAGMPYATHTPYSPSDLYNPTSIANFINTALGAPGPNTQEQASCLAVTAGHALLAGSVTRPVPGSSPQRDARWYPYQFSFSANPSLSTLQPGWISGIAQGAALSALQSLFNVTSDTTWQTAAAETFESYTVSFADGGFVTTDSHGTWFQEYPTSPPTYVLNGHIAAVTALAGWYKASGDHRALDLFNSAVAATAAALPTYAVPLPQGEASMYDATRGRSSANLRTATGSHLSVSHAAVVDGAGRVVQSLSLPVGTPPVARPNLISNGTFSSWTNGVPTSWHRIGSATTGVTRNGTTGVRITTTGSTQSLWQEIPASKLTAGAWYRVSWIGSETPPNGQAGTSGRAWGIAICGSSQQVLRSNSSVRGTAGTYDMLVRMPAQAGCRLRVVLTEVNAANQGTVLRYNNVTVSLPQYAQGPTPRYPISVVASAARVRLTYTGTGELQTWVEGRWYKVAGLSATTTPRTVTMTVPDRFTGINVHLGYHEMHVNELGILYRLTGQQTFMTFARRWLSQAPSMNGFLDTISPDPVA